MKKSAIVVLLLAMSAAAVAREAQKKYEIKSGILTAESTVAGQKSVTTTYFDDFGALEVVKTKVSVPGAGEMEISTYTKDGKTTMVNHTAKQVQEIPVQESVNYLNITDSIRDKFKVQEAGKENVGDRECTKYTQEISQMGQTAKLTCWVYKGIPVKSVVAVAGMEIVTEVVELTENAYILPQTFEIPEFK